MTIENSIILEKDFNISFTGSTNERTVNDLNYIECTWSHFLKVISKPKIGIKKSRGCIVGGKVVNHRNNENTKNRSMITVDLDDVPPDFEDMFQHISGKYEGAFVLYSTHNHTPELPRYRLIIPFNESIELNSHQYRKLVQLTMEKLGLPFYDKASEVLSQVMFLPTVSKENENNYVFRYQDGAPVDAKGILERLSKAITLDYSETYDKRVNEYIEIVQNGVVEGNGRNPSQARIQGHLLNKGVDPVLVYELLSCWNDARNYPPMSEKEFNTTYNSILKKHFERNGGV